MRRTSQERLVKIWEKYRRLLRADRHGDHSGFLSTQLEQAKTAEERLAIESDLVTEFYRKGRYDNAKAILEKHVRADRKHPYPVISLAEHFHYYDVDRRKALRLIQMASRRALKVGEFRYHALGVQARLAVETRKWRLLAQTIRSMTRHRHKTGRADVFPETDFIAHIPKGRVPSAVLDAYARRVNYLRQIGYSTRTGRSRGRNA